MPDSNFSNYYYVDVKATVKIDGKEYPCSNLKVSYALNRVPSAKVELAVGRAVSKQKFGTVSDIMGALTKTEPFTPIEISIEATPQPAGRAAPPGKDKGFPTGSSFPVFKGFIAGPTQSKDSNAGSISLGFDCFGQPGALAGSTSAVTGMLIKSFGGAGEVGIVTLNKLPASNSYDLLVRDFAKPSSNIWKGGLKPIFRQIISGTQAYFAGNGNNAAEVAFARINKGGVLPITALDLTAAAADTGAAALIDQSVSKSLADILWNNYKKQNETTLWDILQACTSEFFFLFVPAIEEDAIAAITPNLGGDPFVVIDPSEYFSTSGAKFFSPGAWGYITDVAMYARDFQTSPWQSTTSKSDLIGGFSIREKKGLKDGKLQVTEAPSWLRPPGSPGKNSRNPGKAVPDQGNSNDAGKPDEAQGEREKKFFEGGRKIGNAIAETIVHGVLFEHRNMTLGGRLRVDIAPGSLVQVNTIGEKFTSQKDSLYGMVEQVTIVVGDAGNGGTAFTELNISHVRNKQEHENLTTPNHPLFVQRWVGGKLLKY